MRKLFGFKPTKPHDIVNQAVRSGCATATFKISRADGLRIKQLEKTDPQAALTELLRILRG
jgi:hypothetical protein